MRKAILSDGLPHVAIQHGWTETLRKESVMVRDFLHDAWPLLVTAIAMGFLMGFVPRLIVGW
jgi:hypothetical protein